MFSRMFKWYSSQLIKRPYTTQIVSSGILWTSADIMAQTLVEKDEKLDVKRVVSTAIYGSAVAGPLFCWWYEVLDRNTRSMVGTVGSNRFVLLKIALDQLLFEPFNLSIYYITTNLMEGRTLAETIGLLRRDFATAYIADSLIWPFAQFLNFKVLHYLFFFLIAVCSATYASSIC